MERPFILLPFHIPLVRTMSSTVLRFQHISAATTKYSLGVSHVVQMQIFSILWTVYVSHVAFNDVYSYYTSHFLKCEYIIFHILQNSEVENFTSFEKNWKIIFQIPLRFRSIMFHIPQKIETYCISYVQKKSDVSIFTFLRDVNIIFFISQKSVRITYFMFFKSIEAPQRSKRSYLTIQLRAKTIMFHVPQKYRSIIFKRLSNICNYCVCHLN